MSLPGVNINSVDGGLGSVPADNSKTICYMGCSTGGVASELLSFGSLTAMRDTLGVGASVEAAALNLLENGGTVQIMTLPPTTPGGLSAVTHNGTGSGTMSVGSAPHAAITVTVVAGGALGTATAKYQVGSGAVSAAITLPSGGTYRVPGTYCVITWLAHTYAALESYVFDTDGTVTYAANGSGGSTASPTQASSPVDDYTPTITVVKAGALATAQITYSLDGTVGAASAPIVTAASGIYAIPGSGIVITLAGTLTLSDTYAFKACGPESTSGDLASALTALETTYLSQATFGLLINLQKFVSASAWATNCATLQTAMAALKSLGVFARAVNTAPTVGTITASSTVVIAARIAVSAARVAACGRDMALVSPLTGLIQRRAQSWVLASRAAGNEASQDVGARADGGITGVVALYGDELAAPGMAAAGFCVLGSAIGLPGFYFESAFTLSASTSDFYPLTNARVIDRATKIGFVTGQPLVLAQASSRRRRRGRSKASSVARSAPPWCTPIRPMRWPCSSSSTARSTYSPRATSRYRSEYSHSATQKRLPKTSASRLEGKPWPRRHLSMGFVPALAPSVSRSMEMKSRAARSCRSISRQTKIPGLCRAIAPPSWGARAAMVLALGIWKSCSPSSMISQSRSRTTARARSWMSSSISS